MPTLWASLSLDLRVFIGERNESNFPSLLSHYLSRSSHVPLALQISDPYESLNQKTAINMLIDHCARWQYLVVHDFPQPSTDQPLILPHLKALSLERWNPTDNLLPIFAHALNLENLEGCDDFVLSWDDFSACSFKKLKGIHNVGLRGASIGQFLAQTPVLEECELHDLSGLIVDIRNSYHISSLTALSITVDHCPPGIWRTLRIPNLTSLTFREALRFHDYDQAAIENTVEEFSAMLLQSGCMLQRFSLKGIEADYGATLLRSHPSVETLMLHPNYVVGSDSAPVALSNLFANLTILDGDNQVPLVPNLRHIQIHNVDSRFADHISNMIRSRADGKRTPLQEVVIKFVDSRWLYKSYSQTIKKGIKKACRELSSRLAPCVDSGLHLSLVEPTWDGYDDLSFSSSSNGNDDGGSEGSDNDEASEGSDRDDSETSEVSGGDDSDEA